jgi:hypothetical protein
MQKDDERAACNDQRGNQPFSGRWISLYKLVHMLPFDASQNGFFSLR